MLDLDDVCRSAVWDIQRPDYGLERARNSIDLGPVQVTRNTASSGEKVEVCLRKRDEDLLFFFSMTFDVSRDGAVRDVGRPLKNADTGFRGCPGDRADVSPDRNCAK